jgi:hypothetical protein
LCVPCGLVGGIVEEQIMIINCWVRWERRVESVESVEMRKTRERAQRARNRDVDEDEMSSENILHRMKEE